QHPMIRQRLGPQRIDFEVRRHHRGAALPREFAGDEKAAGGEDHQQKDRAAAPAQDVLHWKALLKAWGLYRSLVLCSWFLVRPWSWVRPVGSGLGALVVAMNLRPYPHAGTDHGPRTIGRTKNKEPSTKDQSASDRARSARAGSSWVGSVSARRPAAA